MSGIVGFCKFGINFKEESAKWNSVLEKMRDSIEHRGGAYTNVYIEENICMCQTSDRLIESSDGNRLGKNSFLVIDCDIFNPEVLPLGDGIEESVLELILNQEQTGIDIINGGFVIACYDGRQKNLSLFRDHAGIKPLFYGYVDGFIIFASEIKGILKFPGFQAELDADGLAQMIGLGPARPPLSGVLKNIYAILPGHFGIFSREGMQQHQYWGLKSTPHKDTFQETVHNVAYLLKDSVKRQSKADKPLCTFLSGGVDSSIITALAAKDSKDPMLTFSFDFKNNDINFVANAFQPELDRPYVDIMANAYATKHRYLFCDSEELAQTLFAAVKARDMPGMADIDASLLFFCKQVKPFADVALTGECADELFAGYPWFHKAELYQGEGFPWSKNLETRKALLSNDLLTKINIEETVIAHYEDTLKSMPQIDGESEKAVQLRKVSYLTIKWFMATLGDRMDRMSQSSGVQARMPFADKRIIEYLWNVPMDFKNHNGIVKGLLREAFNGYLPDEVLFRKKSPYPKTYNPAYEKLLGEMLITVMNDKNAPIALLLDMEKVKQYINSPKDYGKPWYGQLMAGPQLLAYMLQLNYWLQMYQIKIVL